MRGSATLVWTCAILVILLTSVKGKKNSPPYQPNSSQECTSQETEYISDESNLCCSKCPPGMRLKTECNRTSDSECEPCPTSQYIEKWNYSPKCFSCSKCQDRKGLQYVQDCSSNTPSRCKCRSEMFCILGYYAPYCSDCHNYTLCRPGFGIFQKRAGDADVKCVPCGDGAFSDKLSYEQLCEPHTDCLSQGRTVVSKGDATSDNVCGPLPTKPPTLPQSKTICTADHSLLTTTISPSPSSLLTTTTVDPSQPSNAPSDFNRRALCYAAGTFGLFILILVTAVLMTCKVKQNAAIDANGNSEEKVNKIDCGGQGLAQLPFSNNIPEEQCLLGAGEPCRMDSQSNGVPNTFSGSEGCNSPEGQSISPLQSNLPQSTMPSLCPQSFQPNPMLQLTSMDPGRTNNLPRLTSQPSSPKVNVSIVFNMGNGYCAFVPTDTAQKSPEPFLAREECFSETQQEDGKRSLVAVQESCDYV